MFKETLAFDDVLIVPKYSDIISRSEIDISSQLGDIKLDIPIVSAPMDTVCDSEMAVAMAELGGIGCIHRFLTIAEQAHEVAYTSKTVKNRDWWTPYVMAAVGANGDYLERAQELVKNGANRGNSPSAAMLSRCH